LRLALRLPHILPQYHYLANRLAHHLLELTSTIVRENGLFVRVGCQSVFGVRKSREHVIRLNDSIASEHRRSAVATNPHGDLFTNASTNQIRDGTPSQIVNQEVRLADGLTCFPPSAPEVQHRLAASVEQEITNLGTIRAIDQARLPTLLDQLGQRGR